MNQTVKNYTVAVLNTIIQATLNQTKKSRKYMISLGAIEQSVFRLLNIKKEKQKRNARGFIRTALQALVVKDLVIGVRDFDPDSDQILRSDRPNHFRPTMRAAMWFRDHCENAKDATKTEIITQALRDFGLITGEQSAKDNTPVQASLFAHNDRSSSEIMCEQNFTDETALTEIRNRSVAAATSPWESTRVPNEKDAPTPTTPIADTRDTQRPSGLNDLTPRWWEEFKNKCPEYRELTDFMPESVLIDLVRKTVADYLVRANNVPPHIAANFYLEFRPQYARLADTMTPIEGIVREIFWRAIFYSERIADNGLARTLLLDAYRRNAFDPRHALFSVDVGRSAKALSRIVHAIDAVSRELAPLPPAELSPPMLLDVFPSNSTADVNELPRSCAQIIDWRSVVLRSSSLRKFVKPSRSGFYLTPFGQLVGAILQARAATGVWNLRRIAAWRTASRDNRGGAAPVTAAGKLLCWQPMNKPAALFTDTAAEPQNSTPKEGGLLKNAAKSREKSETGLLVSVTTKDGKSITMRVPTHVALTSEEIRLGPAIVPVDFVKNADEFEETEDEQAAPEPPEDFLQLKYRLVDLAKSTGPELRKHLALRRHEDVIGFLVPDVVNILCDRIIALQNMPLPDADEKMCAEEVCKVALYHALNTLIRIINGLQHYIRKTEIEEKSVSVAGLANEPAFKVDFLADYAAQVVLAIEELMDGKNRVLPLLTTDEELTETIQAAGMQEAPAWSLQRERKITGVNWRICDPTTSANT